MPPEPSPRRVGSRPMLGRAYGPPADEPGPYRRHRRHRRYRHDQMVIGPVVGVLGALAAALMLVLLAGQLLASGADISAGSPAGPTQSPEAQPAAVSRDLATDNALYGTGRLPGGGCRAPELLADETDSMDDFLHAVTDCLDASWQRQFAAADLPFVRPQRVYWTTAGRSPCGSYPGKAAAFYCPMNKTMYIGVDHVVDASAGSREAAVYASVLAHEYGHHVQDDSDILAYGRQRLRDASTRGERNGWSRRIELQAQCFNGLWIGSVRDSLPVSASQYRRVLRDAAERGDDMASKGDHGSRRSFARWWRHGWDGERVGTCDTWSVPWSEVR